MKLVIVESPGKIKKIGSYLGNGYVVAASFGHVRDLPAKKDDLPEKYRTEAWANLGIDVHNKFRPYYVRSSSKSAQIQKLLELSRKATEILLATDADREGEAISWHLLQILKPTVPVHRMVFYEITQSAIQQALQNLRPLDLSLVAAQESRRCVDRLYGYEISPLLWKMGPRLSAGRVQSVALRMVVERELERIQFVPTAFISLDALTEHGFTARLTHHHNQRVATGKDFDSKGKLKEGAYPLSKEEADAVAAQLKKHPLLLQKDEEKPFTQKPPAPFITSSMQQEASRKLGFSVKKSMDVAQKLYEAGYITYMRTDSPSLSDEGTQGARAAVAQHYDPRLLPANPRVYASKNQNAQEAHEAIRPSGKVFKTLQQAKKDLSDDEYRLYELIYKRTLASQAIDAQGRQRVLTLNLEDHLFTASGKTYDELGFRTLYVEGKDEQEEEGEKLPPMQIGDAVKVKKTTVKNNKTQPPARYTEPRLVQTLEKAGIGRPSTYAAILTNIESRGYIQRTKNTLHATWLGVAVVKFLTEKFPRFLDYAFTAEMEKQLDDIAEGKRTRLDYLNQFYFEAGGLAVELETYRRQPPADIDFTPEILKEAGLRVRIQEGIPLLSGSGKAVKIPDTLKPDDLTPEKALELLGSGETVTIAAPAATSQRRVLGTHEGQEVSLGVGKYGPYLKVGEEFRKLKVHSSAVPHLTLEKALQLAEAASSENAVLKELKSGRGKIQVRRNERGMYLASGRHFAPLPEGTSLDALTYQQASDLIKQHQEGRKKRPRG
ncbi:type I DNA topoisomerase [Deinococcus cellulosilyticus]|uniref:DNA topoisomerase 1 n=1 Tax=Deinococcus cellulosilyticus (strain DSM 18568 / NBRC 106333 / KACC 11606 / 5516J-15) TaxID=1223518 RepID=A0A511N8Y0_DEIC1|nr:type I DNA topoisomerase [Deinococcus cellulosilyticus]GEM49299.1 DNA topoisomerase 1 [Deinococcus cellulosilyticus NBRC 106333 = KACC 11606]